MKKLLLMFFVLLAHMNAFAEKSVYIPYEWLHPWNPDTLLYAESDPENKYTWSKSRSMETENFIIFWDKGWGSTRPDKLPASNFYYFDLDYMKERLETFYKHETEVLGFGSSPTSNVNKYKIIVCLNHTEEWTCYGSGYDYQVPALWINPSTSKPVGSAVAHEVGHSLHYMCYSDASKQGTDPTVHTGFHDPIGSGAAIWETTANWQALYTYPNEVFTESGTGVHWANTHNYAFTHEFHRYQAYMFLHYLVDYYNDIQTVYKVWSYPETTAKDFNQVLMDLKGLSVADLYRLHFNFAMHAVTYDIKACKPYLDNDYIGYFRYAACEIGDSTYQVAYSSCPQGTGFNVVPLQLKPAGTQISTKFTAISPMSNLAAGDPIEYHNGDVFTRLKNKTKYNGQNTSYRGFRLGYVVLKEDGTREYFTEDQVYCTGTGKKTVDYGFTVPEGAKRMWLVVAPALSNYIQHKWDNDVSNDDQWPYYFKLSGTDIGSSAILYSPTIIDGREVSDITFEYDVKMPKSANDYSGTTVNISGKALAALGTAYQMSSPSADVTECIRQWSSSSPEEGTCKFYACNPNNDMFTNQGPTTNSLYGHWFTNGGVRTTWSGSPYIYCDFAPSFMSFTIGQYPGKLKTGETYRIVQALRYKKNGKIAKASFAFNITITDDESSYAVKEIKYSDPTGIATVRTDSTSQTSDDVWYTIDGRQLTDQPTQPGIYIHNKKKVMVR
jgi:hypothetical protein